MLQVKNVHKRFGGVEAVRGVSLEARPGSVHAVVGPNGCGKTTLLNLISGFYFPDHGQILLTNGRSQRIDQLLPAARAWLGIGRMFQEPRGIAQFSVLQNLVLCSLQNGSDSLLRSGLRRFECNGTGDQVARLVQLGGLSRAAERPASELSHGQRRVLDCLCSIILGSRLLLLDEPFAGIDPMNLQVITKTLLEEARARGLAVILVSHDIPAVRDVADEVSLMDDGQIVLHGAPEGVLKSELFRQVYLT